MNAFAEGRAPADRKKWPPIRDALIGETGKFTSDFDGGIENDGQIAQAGCNLDVHKIGNPDHAGSIRDTMHFIHRVLEMPGLTSCTNQTG